MKKTVLFILIVVILFSPLIEAEEKIVPLYVLNYEIAENLNSQEMIYPVYRSIDFKSPARNIINKLLNIKFTEKEKEMGFCSEFEKDHRITVKGINLKDGILTVEFNDPEQFTTGGSQRVLILKEQIKKTLLQFNSIKKINILPEYLFQP